MQSALPQSDASDAQSTNAVTVSNLKADFERIARQMYTQNLALVQTNRMLSILRAIDLLILESSRNLPQLSTEISQAIIDESPYPVVAILSLNEHADKYLHFQGSAVSVLPSQKQPDNTAVDYMRQLHIPINGPWVTSKSRNLIIDIANQEQIAKLEVFSTETRGIIETLARQFGLKSLYFTKLKARNSLTGVMIVGLDEPMPMIDDIELIERVSGPSGIAIDNRLLYEENVRIVRQLQQTNDRLKEIDAAKDEFISMASHQLRTPLTSMKGYVSMVLDGDVGDITDMQRSMLQQAYDSSQRMVYLISDLLNVSRLRTGKFIIQNKVTDLAQVVEDELRQLNTAATARKIHFTFHKPDVLPKVMLDEMKIRQVVMNFLDNALYYSPDGGEVIVEVAADDKSIRYTVTDSGLGVPKEEQKYLFTKFYRAQNARKIRPDGTGLGLYMARKVIAAQGGAIIFKSAEGEGSTFGFTFPLDAVNAEVIGNTEQAALKPKTDESQLKVDHS